MQMQMVDNSGNGRKQTEEDDREAMAKVIRYIGRP